MNWRKCLAIGIFILATIIIVFKFLKYPHGEGFDYADIIGVPAALYLIISLWMHGGKR